MKRYILRKIISKRKDNYIYQYFDEEGKRVSQKIVKPLIKDLYIAPALNNVKINRNQKSKVLAIGYDDKGRAQYIYNDKYVQKQSKKKYRHMKEFGESYQKIFAKINRDLDSGHPKNKQIAMILSLMSECGIRIGNEKYMNENQSYGASTLESRHVSIQGDEITVDFIGKKNVRNKCTIKNKRLSRKIRTQKRKRKKRDPLFAYHKDDELLTVKASDVNQYLKQFGDFTSKNLRTWTANISLIKDLSGTPPLDQNERKRKVNTSIDEIANNLHNTRAICKKNYIDPKLIDFYITHPQNFQKVFSQCSTKSEYTDAYLEFLEDR